MASKLSDEEIRACFTALDTDGDGVITREDLAFGIRALGKIPSQEQIKKLFEEIGTTSLINYEVFKKGNEKPFPTPFSAEKGMKATFQELDANNDGTIQESELRQMLLTLGFPMSHKEVDTLMQDVEVDNAGRIRYDRFIDLVINGSPVGEGLL
eukprot:TRINITY_DN1625_c0_g1_i1.p1 TRINITY_DN1625_c0_g1~~TRINITY_DN1625_c0_g1_i1.p1  ORF type:complete len:154 (-),score=34.31 TRINITY_DN1625_c0_g1_i1:86-547(-)